MQLATRWTLFITGLPPRVRAAVTWVAVLPVIAVISRLTNGPAIVPWIAAAVGAVFSIVFARNRGVLVVPDERWLAARAVLTGVSTGDPDLDGYALRILDTRRRIGQTLERVTLSVMVAALLASPIVAGIISSAWWFLMVPLDAAVLVSAVPYMSLDIEANVRRLETATPYDTDSS